jgi:hypothetical protein
MIGGGVLHNAVEGCRNKVCELHLNHGPQTHQRHAVGDAHKSQLRHRHIEDTAFAKLLGEAFGDLERTAKAASNILPH